MNQAINKELIKERFSKASTTYQANAVIQKHIAEHMNCIIRNFVPANNRSNILEIGCGTGLFARTFLKSNAVCTFTMNDLCECLEHSVSDLLGDNVSFLPGDAESINLPDNQDMIISCSAIQWFHNPINFLSRCRNKLSSNGILAVSSFAPENLKEISTISSSGLKYIPTESMKKSLSRHYDIIYCSEESISLQFNSPEEVLKHLKGTGVNAIRQEKWTKGKLKDFCLKYKEQFSTHDGKVTLTYNPVYIICKKKIQ